MASNIQLLSGASATGASNQYQGGRSFFAVSGTFGGATVSLQFLGPDGTTWLDTPGTALTAPGAAACDLPTQANVRAGVTGGTPSGLSARVDRVVY